MALILASTVGSMPELLSSVLGKPSAVKKNSLLYDDMYPP